jgi:aryl-alcohol dehydrogenase-like predicted oxidoreductase
MTAIPRTDLDVSGLCLGGNVFGWTADREVSFAVLDAYAAAGGNSIDLYYSHGAIRTRRWRSCSAPSAI